MLNLDPDTRCVYVKGMRKKLIRHGNSAALILDKPILDLLNVTFDTPLEITTDGRNIVVSPVIGKDDNDFVASLDRINERFSPTLKRLAE
jgi:antitoxin component of MazEF toxin-antitoxin module